MGTAKPVSMYNLDIWCKVSQRPWQVGSGGKFLKKETAICTICLILHMTFVNNQTCVYNLDIWCNVSQRPWQVGSGGKFLKKETAICTICLILHMTFVNNQTCVYNLDIWCNVSQRPWQVGSGSLTFPLHLFPSKLGFSYNFKVCSKSYLLFMTSIWGWRLFLWQACSINNNWIRYVWAIQWRLLDAFSSTHSSLLSSEIIRTHVCMCCVY